MARLDAKLLSSLIAELRRRHPGIFIIAFPHWGWNYDWKSIRQEQEAKNLLAAGVDLVLGHSAHRMQEVERVEGRWVVYSLGNFMFGSPGRYAELHSPPFSLVAMLMFRVVDRQLQPFLKLYPILSDNLQTGYRPRLVNETEFADVVQLLRQRSSSHDLMRTGVDNLGSHLRLELR
ncbi:Capsule biosynthesis protein CapA [Candidatus Methylomirabilis lanthanidiphila]|uniref:Capsule biosynthesis protein CapA n=1 Tax=Candidatus Methylomirabilis lanthanidiphila TaxID=2211376 RepID=A0A564ZJ63_9BACT|nr:CapA family protein [Candidatus Methylomirabilis lanthanidiphila]VUZ85136.1 Capsule biosynthesis protein CapA [Candidatus Methylomirabilis lanthanidiphila]